MSSFMARLETIREQLTTWPNARLVHDRLEAPEFPLDADYEEDLLADGDLVLDDGIRAFFAEVGEVRLVWQVDDRRGGTIWIPDVDTIARSGNTDIEAMAPQSQAERELLPRLRFIHLTEATQWTAFRADPEAVPSLWMRTEGAGGRLALDAPLTLDFAGYLEHLLGTRGVDRWTILYMDLAATTAEDRESLRRYSVPMVRAGLTALLDCPGAEADARRYLERLREVEAKLR